MVYVVCVVLSFPVVRVYVCVCVIIVFVMYLSKCTRRVYDGFLFFLCSLSLSRCFVVIWCFVWDRPNQRDVMRISSVSLLRKYCSCFGLDDVTADGYADLR